MRDLRVRDPVLFNVGQLVEPATSADQVVLLAVG
jgi:hypothetical protein